MSTHLALQTEPQVRLSAYVNDGKQHIKALYGIDFSDDLWQLPADRVGGKKHRRLQFAPFDGGFKDLLKAIVANECATKDGRGSLTIKSFLTLARHLRSAVSGLASMSDITIEHFHEATRSIRNHSPEYAMPTKYGFGHLLVLLAKTLDDHRLTATYLGYRNPFAREVDPRSCDPDVRNKAMAKLPSDGAMKALGEVYHSVMNGGGTDHDKVILCACVVLCCTGFRVNELLALPAECWHEGQYRDEEGRVFPACSIGYAPEKGGTDNAMNRFVAPALVGLAKEALDEILRITEPYRENARIRFNGGINLPPLDETRTYSATEAGEILGITDGSMSLLLRQDPVLSSRPRGSDRNRWELTAQDIREFAVGRCFSGPVQTFPWRLELHEALFAVSHLFFRSVGGMTGTTGIVGESNIGNALRGPTSYFTRFGKLNPETGEPWRISTHGFRHMLNTLFQLSGFTADDIASYFGRKDPRANENYNHMTQRERLAVATAAYEGGNMAGPMKEALDSIKDPIRRQLAMTASFGNTQLSPLGICFHHDGAEIPSIPDRCAVCPGLAIIKGHPALIEETKRQLEVAERTYDTLMEGLSKGYVQDGPWVPLAAERRERLRTMLGMHLDYTTPDGGVIQLGNPGRKKELCAPSTI